jgi:hypothetical protein
MSCSIDLMTLWFEGNQIAKFRDNVMASSGKVEISNVTLDIWICRGGPSALPRNGAMRLPVVASSYTRWTDSSTTPLRNPQHSSRPFYLKLVLVSHSAFGKSPCTYERCWKWCPRASIQALTRLILFANTFCRSSCETLLMYAVIAVLSN